MTTTKTTPPATPAIIRIMLGEEELTYYGTEVVLFCIVSEAPIVTS